MSSPEEVSLADFLLARLAEEKARALAATQGNERYPRWTAEPNMEIATGCRCLSCWEPSGSWDVYPIDGPDCSDHQCWHTMTIGEADAKHIAHWDPVRVLAQCAADERIVQMARRFTASPDDSGSEVILDDVLRLMALSHADHKDYQQGWQPWTS